MKSKSIFRLFLNATGTDRIRSLADLEDDSHITRQLNGQNNRKGGSEMNHYEYWKKVMNRAEKTLCGLFDGN